MIKISVIIPTYNRHLFLEKCLLSLLKQNLPSRDYEIIVIDNGSTGETRQLVQEINKKQSKNIHYFFESRSGLHHARHLGMKKAKGKILSFIDDDVFVSKQWLKAVLSAFKRYPKAVLVGGKVLPKYENKPSDWWKYLWDKSNDGQVSGWLSLINLGDKEKKISPLHVYGCNFSIKKKILEDCDGFHPDYNMPWKLRAYGGDGETYVSQYIKRNNLLTIYNPQVLVYHQIPAERLTKKYLCRRAYLQGISYSYTLTRKITSRPKLWLTVLRRTKTVIFSYVLGHPGPKKHWFCYLYGLIWHQVYILRNPKLLAWIKRKNYFS
jgi:glycosyltransferase involved in cell wall biosynthesis